MLLKNVLPLYLSKNGNKCVILLGARAWKTVIGATAAVSA
jgi:hypothetical protein